MASRLFSIFLAILALTAFCGIGLAIAGDESTDYTQFSLDDLMEMNVVSGASKYMQKASEAPSSISIVTADEIRTYGWRSLWEVLSSLRGFYDTYDRNYYYMGVRGIGYPGDLSSRMLVLVDGIRMNETSLGGVLTGRGFPVDLDLVSRIEVIRGPASSLYGTNAMTGVVNIVTREGYQLNGTEVKSGFSSYGTLESRMTHGFETEKGVDVLISASRGVMEGQDFYFPEFDTPETSNGVAEGIDEEKWEQFYAKVIYEGLTLESTYVWRSKLNPMGGIGMMFNDDRAKTVDIQSAYAATYKRKLPWEVNLAWRAYYQDFTSEIQYPYDYVWDGDGFIPYPEGLIYQNDSFGERLTTELDLTRAVPGGHMVAAGVEYMKTFRNDSYAYDHEPYYYMYYTMELEPSNYSAYVLTDIRVRQGLILNLGFRHDHYKSFASSTNPRLALVTELIKGTVLKAAYGKAFRAPVGYDLPDDGTLDLSPNEIETVELIWEQILPWNLNSTISVYDWDYQDVPQNVDPADINDYFLSHESIGSKGVEFELAGKLPRGIRGRTSWSFNEVEVPDSELVPGRGEPRGPKHMVKANVMVPLCGPDRLMGLELRHSSKRLTKDRLWTEAFTLLNVSLVDTKLLDGPEIRASVYNVFDSDNGHPGTWGEDQQIIWQDGRSYRLYLTLSL
ncbi:MAG: TonB-dependent receptor [Gemmatimonadales bacterium]|nr:TonB-dependent receptor [Gemmatimonadales bacterium]